jgi:hypothetical protein
MMTPEHIEETLEKTRELYEKRKTKAIEYAKTLATKEKQASYIEYVNKELKTLEDLIHALENYDNLPKVSDDEWEDQERAKMKPRPKSLRKIEYMGSREEARAESIRRASLKYNF